MLETNQYTHDNNYCLFEYHDYHDYQIIAHLSYKRAYVCMFRCQYNLSCFRAFLHTSSKL